MLGGSGSGSGSVFESEWRAAAPEPLQRLPAFYVNPDLIQRPTLRMAEGASAVCSALERVRMSVAPEKSEKQLPGRGLSPYHGAL